MFRQISKWLDAGYRDLTEYSGEKRLAVDSVVSSTLDLFLSFTWGQCLQSILISLPWKNKEVADKNSFQLLFGTSGWILSRHRSKQFSAQLLLLLVISPNWNELRTVMNRAEYHLLNYPRVYPQIRKILPFVFAPLVLLVSILIYFNRL